MRILSSAAILFTVFVLLPLLLIAYSRTRSDSPQAAAIASAIDLNPLIRSDAEILGNWSGQNQILMLTANNLFKYETPDHVVSGTWAREDYNLYLKGNSDGCCNKMRFVTFHNHYFVLSDPPDFGEVEGHEWLISAMSSALQKVKESPPVEECPAADKNCNPYDTPENRAIFNTKKTAPTPIATPALPDDARALWQRGQMFEYGEGVPKNNNEAMAWYRRAAEQGSYDAYYSLGLLCKQEQHYGDAYFWFSLWANQGRTQSLADEMAKHLTLREKGKEDYDVATWLKHHPGPAAK